MKTFTKMVMICMLVVFAVAFAASSEATKASKQDPSGTPPYGVAVQSDAAGVKLTGIASIEYYNFRGESTADARISVRLRKGNIVKVFYAEVNGVDLFLPLSTQTMITNAIKPLVVNEFFGGDTSLQVTLKGLEEFAGIDVSTSLTDMSSIYLMDVVVAVK